MKFYISADDLDYKKIKQYLEENLTESKKQILFTDNLNMADYLVINKTKKGLITPRQVRELISAREQGKDIIYVNSETLQRIDRYISKKTKEKKRNLFRNFYDMEI